MLTSDNVDEIVNKYSNSGSQTVASNDLIKLINGIISKLSNTSRFDAIISGKKNIIKLNDFQIQQKTNNLNEDLLSKQYEKTAKYLLPSELDTIDNIIGDIFKKYTNQYQAQSQEHKIIFGNALELEALSYMEKHPRTQKDILSSHIEKYMNQTFYDSMISYIQTWNKLKKTELTEEDFNNLIKFATKFLNIVLQCNILSDLTGGIVENLLKNSTKNSSNSLINYIDNMIKEIQLIPQTRAEYLLKYGVCKMPNPLDNINNSQVNNLDLLPLMKNTVESLLELYTSGNETFELPNGNKYSPKNINERAKGLINKYLSDAAKNYVEKYNESMAEFENNLTTYLKNYMMSCEYVTLKTDIEKWKNFVNSCSNIYNYYQFDNIKQEAKNILLLFLKQNINIKIDDNQIKTESDIDRLLSFYEAEEVSELISHINTITETIIPWKTLYQKLVEGDYKKNEINLITYSFDDIDTSELFGTDVVRAYYEFKEVYNDQNLSESAYQKRSSDITNLLDGIKPQFLYISKSMCRAFRVKFDEEVFNQKFAEAKTIAQKETIKAEKSWMPGNFTLSVNPTELFKIFLNTFDKSYYAWVFSKIS